MPYSGSPATAYGLAGVAGDYAIVGISFVTFSAMITIYGGNIMTDKKISELTSNGTLNGDELVELKVAAM